LFILRAKKKFYDVAKGNAGVRQSKRNNSTVVNNRTRLKRARLLIEADYATLLLMIIVKVGVTTNSATHTGDIDITMKIAVIFISLNLFFNGTCARYFTTLLYHFNVNYFTGRNFRVLALNL